MTFENTQAKSDRLPIGGLLALAMAGFITLMTEVMPAGLLPQISAGLQIDESMAGQLVTAYAAGSFVTAIPMMTLTQAMARRSLLLIAIGGFALVNMATALSSHYGLTIAARFLAGMFGGIVWALLVGYAARMVPARLAGRAIAMTGIGAPLAFSVGVPLGTSLGAFVGWDVAFMLMSAVALGLMIWVRVGLPDFPGQKSDDQTSTLTVLAMPGLGAILVVMFAFVVGHNILYTYIAPLLGPSGLSGRVDLVLLVFGLSSLAGLWIVGATIDRHLRLLVLTSLFVFCAIAIAFGLAGASVPVMLVGVALWGAVAGAAPTLFQTAEARAAGDATDVAQAIFVTVWNSGVAVGGFAGGLLLAGFGTWSLSWAVLFLLVLAMTIARAASAGFSR
ncbi:MFS transporter [Rhizobiales bacterium RZME27]|uniref:MFS transporter n=1 Tax=Endobacterium cereale TaxID=2663029 RepID=A0A6A8AIP2_9HYPH|nr:MFS transporter [Endobacterium cereale]MQY49570.1 MFS transporter [Endobacterium cereale]